MRWKINIESIDEIGGCDDAEMVIKKEFNCLLKGESDLSDKSSGLMPLSVTAASARYRRVINQARDKKRG